MEVTIAGVYDPGPIQPITRWGYNIAVFVQDDWLLFKVDHIEGIPPSRQIVQDLGAVNSAGNTGETEITVARAQDGNLLHVRTMPLDNVEVDFFHGRSTGGRHTTFSSKARVNLATGNLDPHYAASTMFVFGNQRSIYANAYNISGYNLGQSRVKFWGYRYRMAPIHADRNVASAATQAFRKHMASIPLEEDEEKLLRQFQGFNVLPAQGRE